MLKEIEQTLRSHPFVPPRFFENYHIQTFLAGFISGFTLPNLKPERRLIDLSDGSKLAADCFWQKNKEIRSTVIVINGFEGYFGKGITPFGKNVSNKAYHFGFNVIHLRMRGEADTIHFTKSLVATDPVDDLTIVFQEFARWGLKKFYVIGLSGGGWVQLFSLCKLKKTIKKNILGSISISGPIDFFSTWDHANKHPLYSWLLLRIYKNLVTRRINIDPPGTWDTKQLKQINSLRGWGEAYVHIFEKFATIDEYHAKTDLALLLPHLTIPTLIIHAFDDPLVPAFPYTKIKNPHIITLLTKHGGHGGFFMLKPRYGDLDGHWAQNRAMEFIRLLEEKNN
jgi:uncharacterized protein